MIDLRLWQADSQLPPDRSGGPSAPSPPWRPAAGSPRPATGQRNISYHRYETWVRLARTGLWRSSAPATVLGPMGVTVYLSGVGSRRCSPELADLAGSGRLHAALSPQKAARSDDTQAAGADQAGVRGLDPVAAVSRALAILPRALPHRGPVRAPGALRAGRRHARRRRRPGQLPRRGWPHRRAGGPGRGRPPAAGNWRPPPEETHRACRPKRPADAEGNLAG